MTIAILEKVSSTVAKRAANYEAAYQELVNRCAQEIDTPDPGDILKALSFWGKDVHAFQCDVEAKYIRYQLAETAKRLPDLYAELEVMGENIRLADEKHSQDVDRLNAKHAAIIGPMNDRERTIKTVIAKAEEAKRQLTASAPAGAVAAVQEARIALYQARQELEAYKEQISLARSILPERQRERNEAACARSLHPDQCMRDFQNGRHKDEANRLSSVVETIERQLNEAEQVIAGHKERIQVLEASVAEAEAGLLSP